MPTYYRYPEDPTGVNPDNLISGEVKTLSDRPLRIAVPEYAPFFTASLVVYDDLTQRPLIRNVDYRIPTISQEATLRYGLEVADVILIENTAVSPRVRYSYQAVGGDTQNNMTNLSQIFEAFVNDNRAIDWETGVYGKPTVFTPPPHGHYLSDVFGFEPLTFELERIAQAILLGNTPAYELLFKAIKAKTVTEAEIDQGAPVDKFLTLERLLYALDKFNFNAMTLTPEKDLVWNGKSLWFDLVANNASESTTYYWTIEHVGTTAADFTTSSGVVSMVNGKAQFMVQSVRDALAESEELFRVFVRKNSPTGHVLVKSRLLKMTRHDVFRRDHILEGMRTCCASSPRMKRTARTLAVNHGTWHAKFS